MPILKIFFVVVILIILLSVGIYYKFKNYSWSQGNQIDSLQSKTPITLNDVLDGKLSITPNNATWISDTELETISGGNISILNVVSGRVTNLTYEKDISKYLGDLSTFSKITYSADREYLLVTHSEKFRLGWRKAYTAKYAIYNIHTRVFQDLQPKPGEQPGLQLAEWAPIGNSLAFVYLNDIYYKSSAMDVNVVRITNDGSSNILNGLPDWMKGEVESSQSDALWFSSDSKHLAFIKFDETHVANVTIPMYGNPGNRSTIYTQQITIKYPKVGQTNPQWSLNVVSNLNSVDRITKAMTYVKSDVSSRHYVCLLKWVRQKYLLLVTLNRLQNKATTFRCDCNTSICTSIFVDSEPNGWVDTHNLIIIDKKFLTLRYAKNGVQHIFMHYGKSWNVVGQISSGLIHVDRIILWDDVDKKIYFSGTGKASRNINDPSQTQIYSVDDNYETNDPPICITCGLAFQNKRNETCLANWFTFSYDAQFVEHVCAGPFVPSIVIRRTSNWRVVRTIDSNDDLRQRLERKQVPITKDLKVPVATGYTANVRLVLPTDFDEGNKYPLLIYAYGAPGFQQISQEFGFDWGASLVSDKKIIYGRIDGRGSGRQTKDILFQLNRVLGTVEVEDQITATKYLIANYPFIDASRTAIWGWSYGGYTSAMALSKDTGGVFKCGISVAPVTNWLYTYTFYTEKYMKLPTDEDNWENYKAADVTTQVENFRTKKFFLVHGNADYNTLYQNSMMLAMALEQKDILFRQLSYPDQDHNINGPGMRKHLYHSLEDFLFTDCFQGMSRSSYNNPSVCILITISSIVKKVSSQFL